MGSEGGYDSAKAGPAATVAPAPTLNPSVPFKAQPIQEAPALSNLSPDRRERRQALRQTSERLGSEGASTPEAPQPPVAKAPPQEAPPEHALNPGTKDTPSEGKFGQTQESATLDAAPFVASPLPQGASIDTRQTSVASGGPSQAGPVGWGRRPRQAPTLGTVLPSLDGQGPPRRVMEAWPMEAAEDARRHGGGGGGGSLPSGEHPGTSGGGDLPEGEEEGSDETSDSGGDAPPEGQSGAQERGPGPAPDKEDE